LLPVGATLDKTRSPSALSVQVVHGDKLSSAEPDGSWTGGGVMLRC
jgi:hypothetical protein